MRVHTRAVKVKVVEKEYINNHSGINSYVFKGCFDFGNILGF